MKSFLFTFVFLFSLLAQAVGGGGGLRPTDLSKPSPEYIFAIGTTQDTSAFAHGHYENNQWNTQKMILSHDEISGNSSLQKALKESQKTNSWILLAP